MLVRVSVQGKPDEERGGRGGGGGENEEKGGNGRIGRRRGAGRQEGGDKRYMYVYEVLWSMRHSIP